MFQITACSRVRGAFGSSVVRAEDEQLAPRRAFGAAPVGLTAGADACKAQRARPARGLIPFSRSPWPHASLEIGWLVRRYDCVPERSE
jgi:hypothetical protein